MTELDGQKVNGTFRLWRTSSEIDKEINHISEKGSSDEKLNKQEAVFKWKTNEQTLKNSIQPVYM